MNKTKCGKCGVELMTYWLKDGQCNGCRNPETVVASKILVIEVDQWSSTGNIEDQDFDTFSLADLSGGDSEAAKVIFGGYCQKKEVDPNGAPRNARVWYRKGPDGKCEYFKATLDSSD